MTRASTLNFRMTLAPDSTLFPSIFIIKTEQKLYRDWVVPVHFRSCITVKTAYIFSTGKGLYTKICMVFFLISPFQMETAVLNIFINSALFQAVFSGEGVISYWRPLKTPLWLQFDLRCIFPPINPTCFYQKSSLKVKLSHFILWKHGNVLCLGMHCRDTTLSQNISKIHPAR